jgi:hypothetical protein
MERPPLSGGLSSFKRSFPIRQHGQEYFIRNTVCRVTARTHSFPRSKRSNHNTLFKYAKYAFRSRRPFSTPDAGPALIAGRPSRWATGLTHPALECPCRLLPRLRLLPRKAYRRLYCFRIKSHTDIAEPNPTASPRSPLAVRAKIRAQSAFDRMKRKGEHYPPIQHRLDYAFHQQSSRCASRHYRDGGS